MYRLITQMILACIITGILCDTNQRDMISVMEQEMKRSLYDTSDGVILMNAFNAESLLSESTWPWVIEFYVHWCGHCRVVSKTIKSFALSTSNWELHVGVLNCALEHNEKLCHKLNITMYPTLKFFNVQSKLKPVADYKDFHKTMSLVNLVNISACLLFNQTSSLYPVRNLTTLGENTRMELETGSTIAQILVLVWEAKANHLSKIIANDLFHCHKLKVCLVHTKQDLKMLQLEETLISNHSENPLVIFYKNKNQTILLPLNASSPEILTDIRKFIMFNFLNLCPDLAVLSVSLKNDVQNATEDHHSVFSSSATSGNESEVDSEVYWNDVLYGVSYSLRKEIPRHLVLSYSERRAIVSWISFLTHCIPWPPKYRTFMNKFDSEVSAINTSVTVSDITDRMSTEEARRMFPYTISPIACLGSDSTYRGYPCSLWVIFHIATVTCESTPSPFQAVELLFVVRHYIDNFFGCAYCREHFLDMSAEVPSVVKSGEDAVKWLWYSHNKVNARLFKDDSSDPNFPKVQFPPKSVCPDCYSDSDVMNKSSNTAPDDIFVTNPGYGVGDINWNWNVTHVFLQSHYGVGNIRTSDDSVSAATVNEYLLYENFEKRHKIPRSHIKTINN